MNEKLVTFIRRRCLSHGRALERFQLVHSVVDGPGALLLSADRRSEPTDLETEIQDLARELEDHALEHVESCTRSQRYTVTAMGAGSAILGQFSFRLSPSPDHVDAKDSEPATPIGALSLSMRLTESFARMNMSGFSDMLRGAIEENERLRRRLSEVEARLTQSFEEREELASKRHERELELLDADRSNKRKDMMIEQLTKVLPSVLPKVMSKLLPTGETKPEPGDGKADLKSRLGKFMASLTEQQIADISEKLTEDQQSELISLVATDEKEGV